MIRFNHAGIFGPHSHKFYKEPPTHEYCNSFHKGAPGQFSDQSCEKRAYRRAAARSTKILDTDINVCI